MKIKSLQISNILSFAYVDDIANAPIINFDENLSILIGQNGAGKTTVLEIINFVFKKVLFSSYNFNHDFYIRRSELDAHDKKRIIHKSGNNSYTRFRLNPNWDSGQKIQKIRLKILLDEIDKTNLQLLITNKTKLGTLIGMYTNESIFPSDEYSDEYLIDIELDPLKSTFAFTETANFGLSYLVHYYFYKKLIDIYNMENVEEPIPALHEPFTLIGGYRNYHSFSGSVSLGGANDARTQIDELINNEFNKSTNTGEEKEPTIFSLVRLRMAHICQKLIFTQRDQKQSEAEANTQPFVEAINAKLKIVDLKIQIILNNASSWSYSFQFIDTKRNRTLGDINSLSAGQKAIIHLVFEAYGRGDLQGGLVVIDEPEIHLHYQFQNEYMRVIEKLNKEQGCQYILVTHSESLINSETINNVVRLSLDENGHTKINQPLITTDQKWLMKILDNNRSTHAFFGNKVLLVEGETDRYFFRALLGEIEGQLKKGLIQDITILYISGRNNVDKWKTLFAAFGLQTFFIGDLDCVFDFFYPSETKTKLTEQAQITIFLSSHADVIPKIDAEYTNGNYILKEGDLEIYLGIQKDLKDVISFCQTDLKSYLSNGSNTKVRELKRIMSEITEEREDNLW